MCLTAKNFGLQKEKSTSPNRREIPLIRNGIVYHIKREGGTDEQKEREGGREDAVVFLCEKGG